MADGMSASTTLSLGTVRPKSLSFGGEMYTPIRVWYTCTTNTGVGWHISEQWKT